MFTDDEFCSRFLFNCVEPSQVAEYVGLLSDTLRESLVALLLRLPVSEEEWVGYREVGQIDGNEWTWAKMIVDCRTNTEAARLCLLGQNSTPASPDFVDRIADACREYMANWKPKNARPPAP